MPMFMSIHSSICMSKYMSMCMAKHICCCREKQDVDSLRAADKAVTDAVKAISKADDSKAALVLYTLLRYIQTGGIGLAPGCNTYHCGRAY